MTTTDMPQICKLSILLSKRKDLTFLKLKIKENVFLKLVLDYSPVMC